MRFLGLERSYPELVAESNPRPFLNLQQKQNPSQPRPSSVMMDASTRRGLRMDRIMACTTGEL